MPFNIDEHLQELTDLRHRLHSAPEVAGSEAQTAKTMAGFLKDTSPDHLEMQVGGEGILATYEGDEDGPHVLIRCELDALPIAEENDMEYQSQNEGKGHKCGHDGHMAILAGVARWLQEERPKKGKVTLLLQPAEETGEGATRVLEDARFQALQPDYCFALHNLPGYAKHHVVVKEDTFAAASVGLKVHYRGTTAHAAHPEEGKSPVPAVAKLLEGLSSLPQYKMPMNASAKVTVVHTALGEQAFGTSPGEATVSATLRTFSNDILQQLQEECLQLVEGLAETYGLSWDHEWVEAFPVTENHPEAVSIIRSAAEKISIETETNKVPFGWSEDFGRITGTFRGALFGLGAGESQPALHAGNYDFPDDLIPTGVAMFIQIIKEVNNSNG